MRARASVLPLVTVLALTAPASAADNTRPSLNFHLLPQATEPAYKDLPGVKTPKQIEAEKDNDGFTCTTVLRTYRVDDPSRGFRRSLPERLYRCEKDGLVFESRNPPARGAWMPGINPPDAR